MKILLAVLCALALIHSSFGYVAPQEAEPSPRGLFSNLFGFAGDLLSFGFNTIEAVTSEVLKLLTTTATNLEKLTNSTLSKVNGTIQDALQKIPKKINTTLSKLHQNGLIPVCALKNILNSLKKTDAKKAAQEIFAELDKTIAAANSSIAELKALNCSGSDAMNKTVNELKDLATKLKDAVGKAASSACSGWFPKPLESVIGNQLVNALKTLIETVGALNNNATAQYGTCIASFPFVPVLNATINTANATAAKELLELAKSLIDGAIQNATQEASLKASECARKLNDLASAFAQNTTQAMGALNQKFMEASQGLDDTQRAELQAAWMKLSQAIQMTQGGVPTLSSEVSGKVLGAITNIGMQIDGNIDTVLNTINNTKQAGIKTITQLVALNKDGTAKLANCTCEAAKTAESMIAPYLPKVVNAVNTQTLTVNLMNSLANEAPKLADIQTKLDACIQAQNTAIQNQAATIMAGSSSG